MDDHRWFRGFAAGCALVCALALSMPPAGAAAEPIRQRNPQLGIHADEIGTQVALEGDVAVLRAVGGALILRRDAGGQWQLDRDISYHLPDRALLIDIDGGTFYVADEVSGDVYIWSPVTGIEPLFSTGKPILEFAVAGDIIGLCGEDSIRIYRNVEGTWTEQVNENVLWNDPRTPVRVVGDTVVFGTHSSYLLVFTPEGDGWQRQQLEGVILNEDLNEYGRGVDFDGNTIVSVGRHPVTPDYYLTFHTHNGVTWQQEEIQSILANYNTVAVSGDVVIGAYDDPPTLDVFRRANGVWAKAEDIDVMDATAGMEFGSTALVFDGTTLIVGAPGAEPYGAVYFFTQTDGGWSGQKFELSERGSNFDEFGRSVALDGQTIVVGAPGDDDLNVNAGAAYVFNFTDSFQLEQRLENDPAVAWDYFGSAVAVDGDYVVVGTPEDDTGDGDAGSVSVFVRGEGGTWVREAKLLNLEPRVDDYFGFAVDIKGETVVVGTHLDDEPSSDSGSVAIFTRGEGDWPLAQVLVSPDAQEGGFFGWDVAMTSDTLVVAAPNEDAGEVDSGAVHVYQPGEEGWEWQATLVPPDPQAGGRFGVSVDIDGDVIIVGAHGVADNGDWSGAAYVFVRHEGEWQFDQKLVPLDAAPLDAFGRAVAVAGDVAVVGAYLKDLDGAPEVGAVYIFSRGAGYWAQINKLVAPDAAAGDRFGEAVAIDGTHVLVGAGFKDVPETDAGAVYLYNVDALLLNGVEDWALYAN